jgi:hypothetical protein
MPYKPEQYTIRAEAASKLFRPNLCGHEVRGL